MKDSVIKCDRCGRFISHVELKEGGGGSCAFIPDSEVSYEEIIYRCNSCTKTHGKVRPHQFSNIECNSWVF